MDRAILHSDLNSFYASVEALLEPALRRRPVAVAGSRETRHGIVLAKSQEAKAAGVKTGMAIWQARACCPGLTVVPPQYDQYCKYSGLARQIYRRYTDRVEPYGMDECWLDLTGTLRDPLACANEIRQAMKDELGLSVSVGASFNKVFAKLGSDLKKPDGLTVVTRGNYRSLIWPLPAGQLLYCGSATAKKLLRHGIMTIGDLAAADPESLRAWLGVNGTALWRFANGIDASRVMPDGWAPPVKSVGHGTTCTADLNDDEEVWRALLELAQEVGRRLREQGFLARGIQLGVRDNALSCFGYQAPLRLPTRSPQELAEGCRALFRRNYHWKRPVRSLVVRAIRLAPAGSAQQLSAFADFAGHERQDRLDAAVAAVRARFGARAAYNACLKGDLKIAEIGAELMEMPGMMYV